MSAKAISTCLVSYRLDAKLSGFRDMDLHPVALEKKFWYALVRYRRQEQ